MSSHHESRLGGPYRSRNGMLLGVCKGLAEHFDFNLTVVRIVVVVAALCSWLGPVVVGYVVAALFMKTEPVLPLDNEEDAEFYQSYDSSSTMALNRLKRTFDGLDRRIQRMEDIVTRRESDWDARLNEEN